MHGNAGAYATVRVTPEKIVLCFIVLLTFHLGSALARRLEAVLQR